MPHKIVISKKFGEKSTCTKCGIKFYNLNKSSTPCPKCGEAQVKNKEKKIPNKKKRVVKEASVDLISLIRLEENKRKAEVLISNEKLDVSNIKKTGWYFLSEEHINADKTINLTKVIHLNNPPLEGIISYIQTYPFKGIGKETAKVIAQSDLSELFSNNKLDINYLMISCGLSEFRAINFIKVWNKSVDHRVLQILLRELGVGNAASNEIVEKHKERALELIINPYKLLDISYFTLLNVDLIVQKLQLKISLEEKIIGIMRYVLKRLEQSRGHTGFEIQHAYLEFMKLYKIDQIDLDKVVRGLNDTFVFKFKDKVEYIITRESYERDKNIALALKKLKEAKVKFLKKIKNYRLPTSLKLSESQDEALKNTLANPVSIINGGPGTGKTHMIQAITHILSKTNINICLCAPTGKATKRLENIKSLEQLGPKTIHFLLEKTKNSHELKIDALIIDEFSMVDVKLMERMLDLLEPGSMLVMIGDANQLPSVSSGQVFKDLLNSNKIPYTELKENFRQKSDSSIVGIANQIIQKSFRMPKDFKGEFKFWVEKNEVKIRDKILKLYLDHLPKERKINGDKDIQILSPMRKGILGIHALNASIQSRKWEGLNPILEKNEQEKLFLNDKIINTKNNYDLEIMNGDIGEIIRNDKETIVKINNQEVSFNKKDIYSLEPAYAISIHKSQGSEYPIVIIPISKEHTHMLSTNLLYTAITRAKDEVILIGDPEVFINGINSYWKTERDTFLPEALKKLL